MELEAAREILAEVFGVKLSEVDEMIENRFQAGEVERRSREDGCGRRSFGWKDEAACLFAWSLLQLHPAGSHSLRQKELNITNIHYILVKIFS